MRITYLYCLAMLSLVFVLCLLTACGVSSIEQPDQSSTNTLEQIEILQSQETQAIPTTDSQEDPTLDSLPTKGNYDEVRKAMPYKPIGIDYTNRRYQKGYFEIDETAGVLEKYINSALAGLMEAREVPDIFQDDNLIFQTAAFGTYGFTSEKYPLFERAGALYFIPKEHIDLTAKYLFGDECAIDHSNLKKTDIFIYEEEYGVAYRYSPSIIKRKLVPIILYYQDMDDHFQATIVFLTWNNMLMDEELSYYNESAENSDAEEIILNRNNAKDFCYNDISDKYIVRIDKGDSEKLYLRSVLRIIGE